MVLANPADGIEYLHRLIVLVLGPAAVSLPHLQFTVQQCPVQRAQQYRQRPGVHRVGRPGHAAKPELPARLPRGQHHHPRHLSLSGLLRVTGIYTSENGK